MRVTITIDTADIDEAKMRPAIEMIKESMVSTGVLDGAIIEVIDSDSGEHVDGPLEQIGDAFRPR